MKTRVFALTAVLLLASVTESQAQCGCLRSAMQPTRIVSVQPHGWQSNQIVFSAPIVYYNQVPVIAAPVAYNLTPMPVMPMYVPSVQTTVGTTGVLQTPYFTPVYSAPLASALPVPTQVSGPVLQPVPATASTRKTIQDGLIRTASHTSPTPTLTFTCRTGVYCSSTGQCEVLEGTSTISQSDAQGELALKVTQAQTACSGTTSFREVLSTVDSNGVIIYSCGNGGGPATGTCTASY